MASGLPDDAQSFVKGSFFACALPKTYPAAIGLMPETVGMGKGGFRHAAEKKTGCMVAGSNCDPGWSGMALEPIDALEGGIASIWVLGIGLGCSEDCRVCCC